jgi:nucleoid-associated protein YgaU
MSRDKKLGLALGVLLIGIVSAFFFRNENGERNEWPALRDQQKLDQRIAEKPLIPYLTGVDVENRPDQDGLASAFRSAGSRFRQSLDGASGGASLVSSSGTIELGQPEGAKSSIPAPSDKGGSSEQAPLWEVPEFLKPAQANRPDPLAQSRTAPDPIRLESDPTNLVRRGIPNPQHNNAWKVGGAEKTAAAGLQARAAVEPHRLAGPQARMHRVEQGETLSGIAAKYLGSGARYYEVYEANKDLMGHANDLRPGMSIRIPQDTSAAALNRQATSAATISGQRRANPSGTPAHTPRPAPVALPAPKAESAPSPKAERRLPVTPTTGRNQGAVPANSRPTTPPAIGTTNALPSTPNDRPTAKSAAATAAKTNASPTQSGPASANLPTRRFIPVSRSPLSPRFIPEPAGRVKTQAIQSATTPSPTAASATHTASPTVSQTPAYAPRP